MDEFLRTAQTDWRRLPVDLDQLQSRLRRNRWTPHLMLSLEVLGGLVGFAVGLWFLWTAVTVGGLLYVFAAVAMLAAMPVSTVYSIIARRDALQWQEETPDGVLRSSLARAEASLRAIHLGYLGVAVIAGFIAVLWIAEASGFVRAFDFIVVYSLASCAVCLPYVLYLNWRRQRVLNERASCRRLMSDLSHSDIQHE